MAESVLHDCDRDLYLMPIKQHTLKKLDLVGKYLSAYSIATRKAFRRYYVDGFASVGLCQPPRGGMERGSALLSLGVPVPFDQYHFVELDPRKSDLLRHNIDRLRPGLRNRINIRIADANEALPDIVSEFEPRSPSLVFLDPFGMELRFDTLRRLAKYPKAELLLLVFTSGLLRNLPASKQEMMKPQDITAFYGSDTWQALYGELGRTSAYKEFRAKVIEGYLDNLRCLGYVYQESMQLYIDRTGTPLYILLWAAHKDNDKAALGQKIMKEIRLGGFQGQRMLL